MVYIDSQIGYVSSTLVNPISYSPGTVALPVFTVGSTSSYNRALRFNLHPNPKAFVNTSFMTSSVQSGAGSFSRVAVTGPVSIITNAFQNQVSSGTPTYIDIRNIVTALPVNNKASYNFSSYVRVSGSAVTSLSELLLWFANDGTTLLQTDTLSGISITSSSTWTRVEMSSVSIPTNAFYVSYLVRANSTTGFAVGNNIQTTGYLVEGV